MLFMVGLARCGGFFGENSWVPGTLSQEICSTELGDFLAALGLLAPVVGGVVGVAQAWRTREHRTWVRGLVTGGLISVAVAVLVAVSGAI